MVNLKEPSTAIVQVSLKMFQMRQLIDLLFKKIPYLANWSFFFNRFSDKSLSSSSKIPAAAILNSTQCTVDIDDVSRLLAPISAVWILNFEEAERLFVENR